MATATKRKPQATDDDSSLAMAGGAAAGAAAGSFLGPLGAAVGAVVGGVAGARTDRKDVAKAVESVKSVATSKPVRRAANTVASKIGALPAAAKSLLKSKPAKSKGTKPKAAKSQPAKAKATKRSKKPMMAGKK